jgi:hypothetical protein
VASERTNRCACASCSRFKSAPFSSIRFKSAPVSMRQALRCEPHFRKLGRRSGSRGPGRAASVRRPRCRCGRRRMAWRRRGDATTLVGNLLRERDVDVPEEFRAPAREDIVGVVPGSRDSRWSGLLQVTCEAAWMRSGTPSACIRGGCRGSCRGRDASGAARSAVVGLRDRRRVSPAVSRRARRCRTCGPSAATTTACGVGGGARGRQLRCPGDTPHGERRRCPGKAGADCAAPRGR